MIEIIGLVAGLPFDVAAHAGDLILRRRFPRQERIQRAAEVVASRRRFAARSAGIETAPIVELTILVEEIELRRARRPIKFCDLL